MRPACSIKKAFLSAAAAILTVASTGCRGGSVSSITKGEWIEMITEKAGMLTHSEDQPYYLNISAQSEHFNAVQTAVEWKILDPAYPFEPDEMLDREWTAFTLINLMRDVPEGNTSAIKDISKTMFSSQVASAVSSGLLTTDRRGMFRPKKIIDRDEALKCLDSAVSYINNRHFDTPTVDITWADGEEPPEMIEYAPLSYDEETGIAEIGEDVPLDEGDVLCWSDGSGQHYMKAESVNGSEVQLAPYDIFDEAESIQINGSTEVDFTKVRIYDGNGNLIQSAPTGNTENDHIHLMAEKTNTQTFEMDGYEIKLKTTPTSMSFDASKKLDGGETVYASLKMSGLKVDYRFNEWYKVLKDAYYLMDCTTTETIGIKSSKKDTYIGDFSKIDKDNFLSSLSSFLQKKGKGDASTLRLADIVIPIAEVPGLEITVDVEMLIKTDGKAEIVLTQKNHYGFENFNDNMRLIHECDKKQDCVLKASTSVTGSIKTAIGFLSLRIMDAGVRAGAEASVKTTVHTYDDDGKLKSVNIDAPADAADELAARADDVMVCADADGHWILDLVFNSKDTLLNVFCGEQTISFLNEQNAPLFPGGSKHFENWQAVDHCTRKDRKKTETREAIEAKDKIEIADYSITVKPGETASLSILGLPEGISPSQLMISSSDPDIASISGLTVTGKKTGSTIVTISTPDGKTVIYCNVLVSPVKP